MRQKLSLVTFGYGQKFMRLQTMDAETDYVHIEQTLNIEDITVESEPAESRFMLRKSDGTLIFGFCPDPQSPYFGNQVNGNYDNYQAARDYVYTQLGLNQ